MKHLILLTLIFSFAITTHSYGQSKVTQKEKFQATYNKNKALVKTQNYQFTGHWVFGNKKRRPVDIETNIVSIKASKCTGKLETIDTEQHSDLTGIISNYNVNFNDDLQSIHIKYNVNKMKVLIDIKANGNAFLTVESGANNITQRGELQPL